MVSAISEPDTIVLSRDYKNHLTVKTFTLGKKEKIVKMTGKKDILKIIYLE